MLRRSSDKGELTQQRKTSNSGGFHLPTKYAVFVSHNSREKHLLRSLWAILEQHWARVSGWDIFISYARADASECAERLASELREAGYLSFVDTSGAQQGNELSAEIESAVRRCRLMIVLVTPASLRSEWVANEVT